MNRFTKKQQKDETNIIYKKMWMHPGEYIAEVECSQVLKAGDSIMVQMVAYEPETYHSEGVARIACDVAEE